MNARECVAELLNDRMTPAEIIKAVQEELKRQAPHWCHHADGSYRLRSTCRECQTRDAVRRIDSSVWTDPLGETAESLQLALL